MKLEMINLTLNMVASAIITIVSFYMLIKHYGDKKSNIEEVFSKFELYGGKIGLNLMGTGTLFNLIHLSNPPFSEVILNVGLSIFMLWFAIYFEKYFCGTINKNC